MPSQEFNFAAAICNNLGIRAEESGIESLSEPEQTVLLAWWAQGIIGNGGFQYFYEGACNMADVAEAFQELGFPEAAEACRQSMTLFPAELIGGDWQKCSEWMTRFDEDYIKAFFLPLSHVIWDIDDEDKLSQAITQYIRAHKSAFRDVLLFPD